jgi:hypothetical protein
MDDTIKDRRISSLNQENLRGRQGDIRDCLKEIIADARATPTDRLEAIGHLKEIRLVDMDHQRAKREAYKLNPTKRQPKKKTFSPRAKQTQFKSILSRLEQIQ